MSDIKNVSIDRRGFLGMTVSGAMVLAVGFPGTALDRAKASTNKNMINAFVVIEADGHVTLYTPFVEMGQGIHTAIPMMIAEELDVELDAVTLKEAPLAPEYRMHWGGMVRYTGSSLSIKSSFLRLRKAGASARAMLMQAAAEQLKVPINQLESRNGRVTHLNSGQSLGYGELAPVASKLLPPDKVELKNPSDFKLLGKPLDRLDVVEKSNGSAVFGMDINLADMLVATVRQSPVFGGTVRSVNKEPVLKMPGVIGIEVIPNGTYSIPNYIFPKPGKKPDDPVGTVAVVADNFWHAKSALDKLEVEFDDGEAAAYSADEYENRLRERVFEKGVSAGTEGDLDKALSGAARQIEAIYDVPNLAHMVMEPMNCTSLVEGDKCTIWTGSQNAEWVAAIASKILDIPASHVDVVTPYLGCGLGRRSTNDYVVQSVFLAKRYPGRPVKLMWTREEDTQHDFYRPRVVARLQAGFDTNDEPVAFRQLNIADGATGQHNIMFGATVDASIMDSSTEQPYRIPNLSVEYLHESSSVPLGFWRSVGGSHNGYFIESFMDEMAHEVHEDPVAFRRRLLGQEPRFTSVLDRVAEMANWRGKAWKGEDGRMHAMGLALYKDHGTIVGQIAEVSLDDDKHPHVHKVWCAVDCGFVVNPAIASMQIESGIACGLSAALMEKIDIREGRTQNSNFHDYPVLSAQQMPDIDVQFIDSMEEPTGLGEPGTPPIPAALCNAIYNLTGTRIRSLPVNRVQV